MRRLYLHPVQNVRCHGSAALELCNVAAGVAEGHIEGGLDVWDVAAAVLILAEAGGVLRDFRGAPLLSLAGFAGDVLAANHGATADALGALLRGPKL